MKIPYRLFLLSPILAIASANADTLYYEGTGYWNVSSHWWSDSSGTPAGKAPTEDTDVVISGVALSGTINTGGVNIKSLTFDGTQSFGNTQDINFHDGFTIGGDFNYISSGNGNMMGIVGAGNSFNIEGKLTIDASNNKKAWLAFFKQMNTDSRIGTLTIKNGLEIIGGSGQAAAALTLNVKDTFVTGKVKLANANSVLNLTRSVKVEGTFTNNFTCDGIDGTGKITIGATSYGVGGAIPTVIQNIIFNNSTNSSFKGISKGQYNDPVANISADSELNIEMNAASSNAVQTLRLEKGSYDTVADNITVKNGMLSLYGDTSFKTLTLSGGYFSAAAANDPGDAPDIGTVSFESGMWSGGTIVIDIHADSAEADKIQFSGKFDKAENADINLQFNFDPQEMAALVDMGISSFEDLITYEEGSGIEGTVISGVSDNFAFEAVFGATGMDVSFSQVPEPAEFAFAFGAVALLFALRARRQGLRR